jgi:hypothetical protein
MPNAYSPMPNKRFDLTYVRLVLLKKSLYFRQTLNPSYECEKRTD